MKQMKVKNRHHIGDKMKLHLRVREINGHEVRIITLRPELQVSISNNYFHDLWHIIGNGRTAHLLSRLLWGLSFQKTDNTLILIDQPHLTPNPFDASPSLPLIIALGDTFSLRVRELRQIRLWSSKDKLGSPDRTIRWHTFSLEENARTLHQSLDHSRVVERVSRHTSQYDLEDEQINHAPRLENLGGALVLKGKRQSLRGMALSCFLTDPVDPHWPYAGTYTYLYHVARTYYQTFGEVQFVSDYHRLLSSAQVAKKELDLSGINTSEQIQIAVRAQEVTQRDRQQYPSRARLQCDGESISSVF